MNDDQLQQRQRPGGMGRNSSLIAQIVAAVWIAGWSAWLIWTTPEARSITDVITSGLAIAACFAPVYFSILADKIFRKGGGHDQ